MFTTLFYPLRWHQNPFLISLTFESSSPWEDSHPIDQVTSSLNQSIKGTWGLPAIPSFRSPIPLRARDDCWPLYFASIPAYLERKMERVQKTGPLMPLGRTRLPAPSQRLFHITTSRDRNGGKFEKACTAPRQKRRLITDRKNASGSGRGREACLAIMASFAH